MLQNYSVFELALIAVFPKQSRLFLYISFLYRYLVLPRNEKSTCLVKTTAS